ncbi:MAG: dihydroorotate dehydrogenase electron transfer subunit [Gammaproteobacteria bacterium]|nr:dihydroorotate dehydrogenase electron transfer subunit [Gammaproteobacteria bacterium]
MNDKSHRETIFAEQAEILEHQECAGDQYILRVAAPECARKALPGSFAHLQVAPARPLRRPISIMRSSPQQGWVEFLYKAVGEGTRLLARRKQGETLDMLGPIGKPFRFDPERPRPLLIGGGVGMPPMIFAAQQLKSEDRFKSFVILGSEVPFPFSAKPSAILMPEMPAGVIGAMPLLDDWGIASRLTSLNDYPGCFQGYVTDLARIWLEALDPEQREQVEIFSCGPHPMLQAVAALAEEFSLPCQVSLEEFMACGVGGCAGCVVAVREEDGSEAMKRVCVDGPVFEAGRVFSRT